ncbi:MAG: hypothetical protein ACK4N5_01015, partial [Myxococcales bacterium]
KFNTAFEVIAVLKPREGPGTVTIPTTLTLDAYPAGVPTPEVFELKREGATYRYSATIRPALTRLYGLEARLAAHGLKSTPVQVHFDDTPPAFAARVATPPQRTDTTRLSELDPEPSYRHVYRRDETALVYIGSDDRELPHANVSLEVRGPTRGSLTLPVVPSTGCGGLPGPTNAWCGEVEVPLGHRDLVMESFRGRFSLKVIGRDTFGNEATENVGEIPVTRWKWAFNPGAGAIKSAPAIGFKGNIYFGTTNSPGTAFALSPAGAELWTHASDAAITSSLAVAMVDGKETAFVAGKKGTTGAVWAIGSATQANSSPVCTGGVGALPALAIIDTKLSTDPVNMTTAVALLSSTTQSVLIAVRPGSSVPCPLLLGPYADADNGLAAVGRDIFYSDRGGTLHSYTFDNSSGAWSIRSPEWPVSLGSKATSPIIVGASILGTANGIGTGIAFSVSSSGRQTSLLTQPIDRAGLMTALDALTATTITESEKFHRIPTSMTSASSTQALSGFAKGAPAIGSDKSIYIATNNASFLALKEDGSTLWSIALGAASESSVALDCSRDANGSSNRSTAGVAYVGADDGKLYAFIVDSRGIDVTSPWPKFHRDPQNTANASVNLADVVCQ